MAITRVKVRNFKSFDELDVELRPLNIVVGGNAAGKSNFLEIFRFVRDLALHGKENAVSLQGGMEFLANLRVRSSNPVWLEVTSGVDKPWIYHVEMVKISSGPGFEIPEEKIAWSITDLKPLILRPSSFLDDKGFASELASHFRSIQIFDLDPRLPKKAAPVTGRADLEPDGSNLAIVLRGILQEDRMRDAFVRILRDTLPFVEDLKVERFADKSLLIALKEGFSDETYLPAAFLSDGTIHLIALIVALYFDKSDVTIIEEPERNIHPHLISKVAAMLKDASRHKQVIVTTHNPELVKHAELEDLLLVQRDERGFSRITRPAENEQLKVFLENDLGVDELYVQNLLGVGHGI